MCVRSAAAAAAAAALYTVVIVRGCTSFHKCAASTTTTPLLAGRRMEKEICDTLLSLSRLLIWQNEPRCVYFFFPLRKEKENCCFCIPAATSSDPFRTGSVVKSSSATCYVDEFCRLSVVIQLARKTLRNPINLDSFLIFLFRRCRVSSSLYCSIEFHF